MKTKAFIPIALAFLGIAAHAEDSKQPNGSSSLQTTTTARIRMFGQNGASAVLFRDSACVKSFWSSEGEKVSGGLGNAFSSFAGTVSNTSLGIPETDTTRNLDQKNGLLSKAYYREYEIPAGKPTSMRMGFRDVSSFYVSNGIRYESVSPSCSGAITFTPEAGKDYEAGFAWEGRVCTLSVNQVLVKDDKTELVPVTISVAPDC